jgi:DNA-binding NarL/FixJ family response regulator
LIADDAPMIREALVAVLERAGHRTTAVADAAELIAYAAKVQPDVCVVDIRMPPTHSLEGLEAAMHLRRTQPDLPLMLLSQRLEVQYLGELLESGRGGVGYLLKERVGGIDDFVEAVERVAAGGVAIDPDVVRVLMGTHNDTLGPLGERDLDVLRLMARGMSNRAIALDLHLALKTVENRISAIFTKLGLVDDLDDNRRVIAVLTYLRHEWA